MIVTVANGQVTTRDVALVPYAAQGVTGAVVDDHTGDPVVGAEVPAPRRP